MASSASCSSLRRQYSSIDLWPVLETIPASEDCFETQKYLPDHSEDTLKYQLVEPQAVLHRLVREWVPCDLWWVPLIGTSREFWRRGRALAWDTAWHWDILETYLTDLHYEEVLRQGAARDWNRLYETEGSGSNDDADWS